MRHAFVFAALAALVVAYGACSVDDSNDKEAPGDGGQHCYFAKPGCGDAAIQVCQNQPIIGYGTKPAGYCACSGNVIENESEPFAREATPAEIAKRACDPRFPDDSPPDASPFLPADASQDAPPDTSDGAND